MQIQVELTNSVSKTAADGALQSAAAVSQKQAATRGRKLDGVFNITVGVPASFITPAAQYPVVIDSVEYGEYSEYGYDATAFNVEHGTSAEEYITSSQYDEVYDYDPVAAMTGPKSPMDTVYQSSAVRVNHATFLGRDPPPPAYCRLVRLIITIPSFASSASNVNTSHMNVSQSNKSPRTLLNYGSSGFRAPFVPSRNAIRIVLNIKATYLGSGLLVRPGPSANLPPRPRARRFFRRESNYSVAWKELSGSTFQSF